MIRTAPQEKTASQIPFPTETLTSVRELASAAIKRIAPLWPLQNFVAVNPFLGVTGEGFLGASALLGRITEGGMQMPLEYYRSEFRKGAIQQSDLGAALAYARKTWEGNAATFVRELPVESVLAALDGPGDSVEDRIPTLASAIDQEEGSSWEITVIESIARFCAAHYDENQSTWRSPWSHLPLFDAWKKSAAQDPRMEYLGLGGYRKWIANLPDDPLESILLHLARIGITSEKATDFLHQQLFSIRGWAGRVQYFTREKSLRGESDDSMLHLLAIRLAHDVAVLECGRFVLPHGFAERIMPGKISESSSHRLLINLLWQMAQEQAWQRQFFGQLLSVRRVSPPSPRRKSLQAIFCIDVRSEVFRRALEAQADTIETLGFAGFFGVALEQISFGQERGGARCPVLLTPGYRIKEGIIGAGPQEEANAFQRKGISARLNQSWNSFKSSAVSSLSFVETAGLGYGVKLLGDSFRIPKKGHSQSGCRPRLDLEPTGDFGIPAEARVALALGALVNMGLTKHFARFVLLCGHGSETTNNPYGSGLDCGACGGHAGDANARVAAMILNDPAVRSALAADHEIAIPEDTWFISGLHNTTTDEVTLFDLNLVPAALGGELEAVKKQLAGAGVLARRERASRLGLDSDDPALDRKIKAKASDWSELRPEWGLAGNAAFIAAPRERTAGISFGGRAFLHNYNHHTDLEKKTLELIMVAPMVVANWINLQYYASTVNNAAFGSGDKAIHNVVGTTGVCQGNGGDLLTGLPLQSVHDGKNWVHEPLRLHVVLEAPRTAIDAVLATHESVRELVAGSWLHLFAIEEEGAATYQCLPRGEWLPVERVLTEA